jgi:hypothetical protein
MEDIRTIQKEFNKIVSPKEKDMEGSKAKALLQKNHYMDSPTDNLGKNIGHRKFNSI